MERYTMPEADESDSPARGATSWLCPRRGEWRRALLRLTVVVGLVLLFRYHVLALLAGTYDLAWRMGTGRPGHHPGSIRVLQRLRGPGVRMLVRIGEPSALSSVRDPGMIPPLLDMASTHPDPTVRVHALQGLSNFWDARVLPLAAKTLDDADPSVRAAAAQVLGELGDERYGPMLHRALKAEHNAHARTAVEHAVRALPPAADPYETASGEPTVKVAAIQHVSVFGQPEANRRRLERSIREAAANGAKIIVLPETAITGYMSTDLKKTWHLDGRPLTKGLRGVSPDPVAETVPGASTRAGCALAKELGVYLTVPFLEVDPETQKYYNTLCLAGPDGRLLLHYRKLNPWPYAERGWTTPGERGHAYVDTPYGRLGLLICYDINFEPPRMKKLKVDILLYSIAWVDIKRSNWFYADLPRIARENQLNIIGANWSVPRKQKWSGYGQSLIIKRTGRVLARVSKDVGDEIIYAELPVPDEIPAERVTEAKAVGARP